MKLLKFTKKGIYCIPGKFYLDPWLPVDHAIISHGHADHARAGMKHYLCHDHSKAVLQHRIGSNISIQSIGYNQPIMINNVTVSLHPAGHIIGSAQIRLEYKGYVIVFSGDYKTIPDYLTEPFEPVKCHEFITESTFGLPIYNWLSEQELQQQMLDWVLTNQANHRTSVFIGYSLGKAQRIMKILEGTEQMYVHSAIHKLNAVMYKSKIDLPKAQLFTADSNQKELKGKIIILPPALLGTNLIKQIPNPATAICSGWMQIRGNRRWKGVDAGFAVSDHADWKGLLSAINHTGAEKVFVTHGSQAIFTKYLNEIGVQAAELKTEYGADESNPSED